MQYLVSTGMAPEQAATVAGKIYSPGLRAAYGQRAAETPQERTPPPASAFDANGYAGDAPPPPDALQADDGTWYASHRVVQPGSRPTAQYAGDGTVYPSHQYVRPGSRQGDPHAHLRELLASWGLK